MELSLFRKLLYTLLPLVLNEVLAPYGGMFWLGIAFLRLTYGTPLLCLPLMYIFGFYPTPPPRRHPESLTAYRRRVRNWVFMTYILPHGINYLRTCCVTVFMKYCLSEEYVPFGRVATLLIIQRVAAMYP